MAGRKKLQDPFIPNFFFFSLFEASAKMKHISGTFTDNLPLETPVRIKRKQKMG